MLAARHLEDEHPHEIRIAAPGAQQDLGDLAQLLPGWVACLLDALDRLDQRPPGLTKDAAENVLLRLEVVVEQPVGDARLLCDVAHAARVVALAREDPHRCVEEQSALVFRRSSTDRPTRLSVVVSLAVEPLAGLLVVDLTRYLPGPFASRELLGLGARVVRLEAPGGDPLRELAPAWHEALNAGKESVTCDLKADPETGRELCARADVVLESFRPGVAERLGVGPDDLPETVVYCSFTGFGPDELRAGHDLNYQGYAGLLADTAPAMPPVPIADLAGGGLTAVTRILAALLERERTGRGRMSDDLTDRRRPPSRLLSARRRARAAPAHGWACLLPHLRHRRLPLPDRRSARAEVLLAASATCSGRPDLTERQWDADQEPLAAELAEAFASKPLASWLELVEGEDVGVGPGRDP